MTPHSHGFFHCEKPLETRGLLITQPLQRCTGNTFGNAGWKAWWIIQSQVRGFIISLFTTRLRFEPRFPTGWESTKTETQIWLTDSNLANNLKSRTFVCGLLLWQCKKIIKHFTLASKVCYFDKKCLVFVICFLRLVLKPTVFKNLNILMECL